MEIGRFFTEHRVDEYAAVAVDRLMPMANPGLGELLPFSKNVIVFGKVIPRFLFGLDNRIKSFYAFQLMKEMDLIALELSDLLSRQGEATVPVPTFFPARIRDGRIGGVLSLKQCAEAAGMGSIGLNTLLISGKYGNRLCLGAVLTEREMAWPQAQKQQALCLRCRKCVDACPTGAIEEGSVAVTKCLNFTNTIPGPLRPLAKLAIRSRAAQKHLELIFNTIGWNVVMVCSRCLTECPHFLRYDQY